MSDRETTANLMGLLERHYLRPSDRLPAGVFLPEVGWNGYDQSSRCDALFIGFTSASGRLLVGHEVKASRADWLRELAKPGKADGWADQCHQWWLVTAPGVVQAGELPEGWGLMVPGPRTRMKIITAATTRNVTPSWDVSRSIVARLNTIHRSGETASLTRMRAELQAGFEDQVAREVARRTATVKGSEELRTLVERYETALGGTLTDATYAHGDSFTEAELAEAAVIVRRRRAANRATQNLQGAYELAGIRRRLEATRCALEALAEVEQKCRAADDSLGKTA